MSKKFYHKTVNAGVERLDSAQVRKTNVVKRADVATKRQLAKFAEVKRRIRAALDAGASYEECGAALGVPASTIEEFDLDG